MAARLEKLQGTLTLLKSQRCHCFVAADASVVEGEDWKFAIAETKSVVDQHYLHFTWACSNACLQHR
ncbi:unnamed protein product [Sphenostylis stenocarpa]|uniref:Uncharacterized protein n=1 Tax=Sphenostylis stenocarpa TaxID=92480 RepID=A0AA86RVX6_9FABA|nr:unnamed protein product [Sphenostylis stenocarpa]